MAKSAISRASDETPYSSKFHKKLVGLRAERMDGFIVARGNRFNKNFNDKTGVTYAFWVSEDKLK